MRLGYSIPQFGGNFTNGPATGLCCGDVLETNCKHGEAQRNKQSRSNNEEGFNKKTSGSIKARGDSQNDHACKQSRAMSLTFHKRVL